MKRILKTVMISVVTITTVFGTYSATAANIHPHYTGADVGFSSTALPFENPVTTLEVDESTLPQSYSSRDLNYLTPVRNQQNTQSCWAFGGLATLESLLIKNGKLTPEESQWLSVAHMDAWGTPRSDSTGWQRTYSVSPGYPYIALGYLTSWSGAVKESLFPFTTPFENINLDDPEDVKYGVSGVMYVNGNDPDTIKKCIMDYGAVSANYNSTSKFLSSDSTSHYCPTQQSSVSGHNICVVGWDDNYSKENFRVQSILTQPTEEDVANGITEAYYKDYSPQNDGAWLCKNSWGNNNSLGGYFWISYEDYYVFSEAFGPSYCITDFVSKAEYNNIYQVEKYGATYEFNYLSDPAYKIKSQNNVFVNLLDFDKDKECIDKVMFETTSVGAKYDLYYIPYDETAQEPTDNTSLWKKIGSGTVPYSVYVSIDIEDYPINKGKAGVGVRIDATGTDELSGVGVSEWLNVKSTRVFTTDAKEGLSYIYRNGVFLDVMDFYSSYLMDEEGGNFVIKAITTKQSNLMGDANLDREVNVADVTFIQKFINKEFDLEENALINADFNKDGKVNIKDCTAIQKFIAQI